MWLLLFAILGSVRAAPTQLYAFDINVQLNLVLQNTAKLLPLGLPLPFEGQGQGDATYGNRTYWIMGYNFSTTATQAVGVSMQTATVTKRITFPLVQSAFVDVGTYLEYDSVGNALLAAGRGVDNLIHIYSGSTTSAVVTNLFTIAGNYNDCLGCPSGFDPVAGVFWVQYGTNTSIVTFGVNVRTRKLQFTLDDSVGMEAMAFDPKTGLIWGIGMETSGNATITFNPVSRRRVFNGPPELFTRTLVTLNSHTGKFATIAPIPEFYIIEGGVGTLDIKGRTFTTILSKKNDDQDFFLVSVDIDTHKVLYSPLVAGGAAQLWSLEYMN